MSNRREADSRPGGTEVSQRNTARDVPAAKFREGSVGTVAPRGLRGPSLLPGQGAPERLIPEEVELAVLRDAETLDSPNVGRATSGGRVPDLHSPSLTPVAVEVPRARSAAPLKLDEYVSTPPSPSARSIQSGTLMSIGSVDPRARTELSLPSPRPLSVSERAAYLGPEAVVDRAPIPPPGELPAVVDSSRFTATERPTSPNSGPLPSSSARGGYASAKRSTSSPDSEAPQARHFERAPQSFTPPSPSMPQRSSRAGAQPSRRSGTPSTPDVAPRFQIHAELAALPHDLLEDNFDLRSASTQREPLASRKQRDSADCTPYAPAPESELSEPEPSARPSRHSSSAVTVLVDRGRDTAPATSDRVLELRPVTVPLSWALGAAAFAVVLAVMVAWMLRAPATPQAVREADGRASAAALRALPLPLPAPEAAAPEQRQPGHAPSAAPPSVGVTHTQSVPSKAVAPRVPASAAAPTVSPAPAPADSNSKVHQSIY